MQVPVSAIMNRVEVDDHVRSIVGFKATREVSLMKLRHTDSQTSWVVGDSPAIFKKRGIWSVCLLGVKTAAILSGNSGVSVGG